MFENYVVKEHLTDRMIEAGDEVTRRLVESGGPVDAVFWWWDPEFHDDWQFVVSASSHVLHAPGDSYDWIFSAIDALDEKAKAEVINVFLPMGSERELVRAIRSAYPTGGKIVRMRLKKHFPNGKFIPDALLYWATSVVQGVAVSYNL